MHIGDPMHTAGLGRDVSAGRCTRCAYIDACERLAERSDALTPPAHLPPPTWATACVATPSSIPGVLESKVTGFAG